MRSEVGKISAEILIIVVALLVIIGFVTYKAMNKEEKIEYYLWKANGENITTELYDNYAKFRKLVKTNMKSENDTMQNMATFEKSSLSDHFNKAYFDNKKVVVVGVYEDDGKIYNYSIKSVNYNEDRTEVTVVYEYKVGDYVGTISDTWFQYMLVEVDNTVNKVIFSTK